MSTLRQVMDEMRDKLEDVFDGADVDIQVDSRWNKNPTPPTVDIFPGDPFRDSASAGFAQLRGTDIFTVRVRVSTADTDAGQDLLLALIDDEDDLSIAAALFDDQTLNGLASSVDVEGPSGYAEYVDPGGQGGLLGCEFKVSVLRLVS